jgi:hypothetical protein
MSARASSSWSSGWAVALAGIATAVALYLWSENRAAKFDKQFGARPTVAGAPALSADWFQTRMLKAAAALPSIDRADSSAFPGTRLQGEDLLAGNTPLALACRAELARWSAGGELPVIADRLRVEANGQDSRWQTLVVEARGSEAAALATLQHLLAAPGSAAGYYTDPARVSIEVAARDQLQFELQLRVWPAASFLDSAAEGTE